MCTIDGQKRKEKKFPAKKPMAPMNNSSLFEVLCCLENAKTTAEKWHP
jgi:hypothetical protein